MADAVLKFNEDQIVDVTIGTIVDSKGREAKIDGPIEWSSSDPNVVSVEVDSSDAEGKIGALVSVAPGKSMVAFAADSNLDPEVKETFKYEIEVTIEAGPAGPAKGFNVTFGDPRPKA